MQFVDTIIHAKWIYTGEIHSPILENHAVIIHEGKILDIVHTNNLKNTYASSKIQHFPKHIITPGLINAHTHIGMNYFRGLSDDRALMEWLTQYIFPAEKKWLSHDLVYDASLFAIAEMIRSGTTCFNDMFYFPLATAQAVEQSGIRAFMGMHFIDFPTNWTATLDETIDRCLEFYQQYKHHPHITPTLAPHAPYTISDETFLRVKDLSEKYHLKINLHLHETQDEIKQSLETYHCRPTQRLEKLGLLSPQLMAIHSVHLNHEDLELYQKYGVQMIHCPESNMKLASGIAPIIPCKQLGINVALGTDSVASNNDLDMFGEMRSAALLAKVSTLDPTSLNAAEAFEMATLNGAKVLGAEQKIGTLTQGKAADFIAIQLDNLETLPVYHPIAQIIYAASRHQVTDLWVSGNQLMKNRSLITLDEESIAEKARYWGNKILHETH